MGSKLVIFVIAFLYIYIFFNRLNDWRNDHIAFQWDRSTYYVYLPAIFIYGDLAQLSFYKEKNQEYFFTGYDWDVPPGNTQPNGRVLDKYPVGTAIMEAPFFFIAHAYCTIRGDDKADGFSLPYQEAVAFCAMFWVVFGLFLCRSVFKRNYSDGIICITLLCIAFGTNLYHYTAFEQGMSHPISFFLFAAVLYLSAKWHESSKRKYIYWLAIVLGLVTLTRPVNIVVGLIPLLWGVYNADTFKQRLKLLKKQIAPIVIGLIVFSSLIFTQLAYWKYITGHWIYYSYEGEGFNLPYSKIYKGLFSYQKGWFVYTPMALIGILGLIAVDKKYKLSLISFFAVMIYITFSWKQWWYGWGFGCRPLVDTYAILAFPLAASFTYIYEKLKYLSIKIVFSTILMFFIGLNLFQTYQYSKMLLHGDRMTKAFYWKVFGKLENHENMDPYLISPEEYNKDKE